VNTATLRHQKKGRCVGTHCAAIKPGKTTAENRIVRQLSRAKHRRDLFMSKNAEGQSPTRPVWGTVHYVEHGYSLPRTTIYQGIKDGLIESRVVGVTPDKRGRRVIRLESVDEFIRRSPSQSSSKMRRAMAKLAKASVVSKRIAKLSRRRGKRGAR